VRSIRLRPARKKDLESIYFIERQCFPTPWSGALFLYELKKPYARLWVLEHKEKIIGYICFWIVAGELHLANIAVDPAWRRRGLATFMLQTMFRYARKKGAKRVLLEVRQKNLAAQTLYKRLGFQVDGRRKQYYSDTKEDAILMSLDLKCVRWTNLRK